ncbi:MAG TPA: Kazal-type serine protease inhibitor [Polyangiaceae bacterium]|nr:Kazal-type serine protease inhibitor [Polyangiaceae bacterium]
MASDVLKAAQTIFRGLPIALVAILGGCSVESPQPATDGVAAASQDSHWAHHFCGGPSGATCGAGEACLTFFTRSCPGPHAAGICVPRPSHCPAVSDPVCGCDGVTYDNYCEAAQAGVSFEHKGACEVAPSCDATHACPGAGTCVSEHDRADDHLSCDRDRVKGIFHDFGFFGHHEHHHDGPMVCECSSTGSCAPGQHWNDDPAVCACEGDTNPCDGFVCRGTDLCVPQNGEATCVPDACSGVVCRSGEVCTTANDGSAQCTPDACSGVVCRSGEVCATANDGSAACVTDACAGVVCKGGQTCTMRSDGAAICR